MNKIFNRIASLILGLSLVTGVAFLSSKVSYNEVKAGTATDTYTMADAISNNYNKYENDDFIVTLGGGGNTVGVNTNATNWTKLNLSNYSKYAVSPVTTTDYATAVVMKKSVADVTSVSFAYTTGTNCNKGSIYLIYSSDNTTYSLLTITSGTAQGSQLPGNSATSTFHFNACSGYFGIILKITGSLNSGSNWKYTNCTLSLTYETATPTGTLSIVPFAHKVIEKSSTGTLQYNFEPASGDTATIVSHTWTSSDASIFSVSGDSYSALNPGLFSLNLQATDSNGVEYSVDGETYYVSNALDFEVGDDIAIVSLAKGDIPAYELTGINSDSSTHVGYATEISGNPKGTYRLTVGAGELDSTYSFINDNKYLYLSGDSNSLGSNATLSAKTSWYVVAFDDHKSIINANLPTREILMNYNSGEPRFATYKETNTTKNYPRSNIVKLAEPTNPRGTISITSPDATTMKLGDTGALSYNWTPNAEAPSVTISSIEWSSTDSNVISVDNTNYSFEAVGEGTVKLSFVAYDSLGEEYLGSTGNIKIINCVSGDYEKVTSIAVGDTVAIVCEAVETELSGIEKISSNYVGVYAYYVTAPGSVYDLTVVAGATEGTFAFQDNQSKYLNWKSDNTLSLSDELDSNSSWTVSFDGGNALINNAADSERQIWWNVSNPRFACYTGKTDGDSYKSIQLYAPVLSYSVAVVNFATSFLEYECDENGQTRPDPIDWLAYKGDFEGSDLTNTDREDLRKAKAVEYENPTTDVEKVQAAMAKYDYIIVKYNKIQGLSDLFPDFINRDPAVGRVISVPTRIVDIDDSMLMMIVIIYSVVSISSISALIIIKRKKHLN